MPAVFTAFHCEYCYAMVRSAQQEGQMPAEAESGGRRRRLCLNCIVQFHPCVVPGCELQHYLSGQSYHGAGIVWRCIVCQTDVLRSTMSSPQRNLELCAACFARLASQCDTCGQWRTEQFSCRCTRLEGHSFKPTLRFHRVLHDAVVVNSRVEVPKRAIYLGYELEVEATNPATPVSKLVKTIRKFSDLPFFCKADGSLFNGVEIVSHPATLEAWRFMWPRVEELYQQLRELGARSFHTTTCGLHIHVNRTAFVSQLHLLKLCRLLYSNQNDVFKLSQRQSFSELAQWAKFDVPVESLLYKLRERSLSDRYSAVNVTNRSTVEFRFFKGTLEPSSVWRALESVNAFVEYSRRTSAKLVESFDLFTKFVRTGKRSQYTQLANFFDGQPSNDTFSSES